MSFFITVQTKSFCLLDFLNAPKPFQLIENVEPFIGGGGGS